jgi:hypothetical protein
VLREQRWGGSRTLPQTLPPATRTSPFAVFRRFPRGKTLSFGLLTSVDGEVGPTDGMSDEKAVDATLESRRCAEQVSAPDLGLTGRPLNLVDAAGWSSNGLKRVVEAGGP